jgi:putative MATE family efflux protein
MFESALQAQKKTRAPMLITLVITLEKAVLNFGLIFGMFGLPRLGLIGAGVATVAAHATGMTLYLLVARIAGAGGLVVTFGLADVSGILRIALEVLRVALPAILERFIMSLALLTYFAILSDYGTAAVAAYAIGVRLLSFSWVPGLGFATAASTFVGQALGASDPVGAKRVGRRAVLLAVLLMTGLGALCMILREPLARVFTHDEQVIANLLPFMTMLAVAQPFMGAHFTLGGVLRGAGDTITPLIGAGVGNWVFRVPLAFLYAKGLGLEIAWVWSALIADHLTRMTINGQAFLRGRWARRTGAGLY